MIPGSTSTSSSFTQPDGREILLVDDDRQILLVLSTALSTQGYTIRTATDGDEALHVIREYPPDLVITDLCMPHMDGLELCRNIRSVSAVPIIVLSVKAEESDKVEALDAGADDYVTKPFAINELTARVRAALRSLARQGPEANPERIENGDFCIDVEAHCVHVRGKELHLTPKEFDLLVYFARHPGKMITHRKLLANLWSGPDEAQIDSLRVLVGHLRNKISPAEGPPAYIYTEHWVGYRFEPGGE